MANIYLEVNLAKRKPAQRGWYNLTADVKPRAMGRVWFNGERFHFETAAVDFRDVPNHGAAIYWLEQITQIEDGETL